MANRKVHAGYKLAVRNELIVEMPIWAFMEPLGISAETGVVNFRLSINRSFGPECWRWLAQLDFNWRKDDTNSGQESRFSVYINSCTVVHVRNIVTPILLLPSPERSVLMNPLVQVRHRSGSWLCLSWVQCAPVWDTLSIQRNYTVAGGLTTASCLETRWIFCKFLMWSERHRWHVMTCTFHTWIFTYTSEPILARSLSAMHIRCTQLTITLVTLEHVT